MLILDNSELSDYLHLPARRFGEEQRVKRKSKKREVALPFFRLVFPWILAISVKPSRKPLLSCQKPLTAERRTEYERDSLWTN